MNPTVSPTRWRRWLAVAILAIVCPACGPGSATSPAPRRLLPDPRVARGALEAALEEWRTSPQTDTAAAHGRSLIFVDQQRQPGQKLRSFKVLSSSEVDNRWRFVVRLDLTDPDESILAPYYVFNRSPIWVYRGEDFDMMMNMDMAPETVPPPADPAKAAGPPGVRSDPRDSGATDEEGQRRPGIDREKREMREQEKRSSQRQTEFSSHFIFAYFAYFAVNSRIPGM